MLCLWCGRTVGWTYGHVIIKISRMGRLPHFLTHAWRSATRASRARVPPLTLLLPVNRSLVTSLENIQHIVQSEMVRIGTLTSLRMLYNTVADPGEGLGPPPYFQTKLRPEGPKKTIWRPPPSSLLSKGLDAHPPPPPLSQGLDPALQ